MSAAGRSIVLFPGLGADARLFREQKARFPGLTAIPWIAPRRGESLAQYAGRLVPAVAQFRPSFVGGASFGGMVALEIARILRPDGVVLLGSCRSPRSVRGMFRLGARFAALVPDALLQRGDAFAPYVARLMGSRNPETARLLAEMYRSVPRGILRWGAGAISDWPGLEDPGVPVRHIHGQSDRVIPLEGVQPDRVVPGAGHLLTLTHPEQVNEFLAEVIMGPG